MSKKHKETTPSHPDMPKVLSGCDGSLEEMEQRVRCDEKLSFTLDALENAIRSIKNRKPDLYDRYMPMFMLLGAYNASDKLNQLITIIEEEFFNRFYKELSDVHVYITTQQNMNRLPSRDAYHIKKLEELRKNNHG